MTDAQPPLLEPQPRPQRPAKRRVAILGGGVGAITAAMALTDSPESREQLEVTVYQLGWRLGGKGASGRNAAHGRRIEEHGLHVWLGWYHNAFALLRRAYAELGRPADAPLATIDQAFAPHDYVGVSHGASSHGRTFWMLGFPRTDRAIGGDAPAALRDHLEIAIRLIARHLRASLLRPLRPEQPRVDGWRSRLRPSLALGLAARARRRLAARLLDRLDEALAADRSDRGFAGLERLRATLARVALDTPELEHELEGLQMLLDFGLATARGLVADRALLFGLDVLDAWDLRAWLTRHGARPSTVEAPFIKAWYDLAFAYEQGDTTRPNFGAGAALRAILRTALTYEGAIFWKMQAGMGDVVFAPYYELLRRRGVRFEFFHRVDEVEFVAGDPHRVAAVRMTVQATTKSGGEYQPLVEVAGLPCWPSAPMLDQLHEAESLAGVDLECPWSAWPGVGTRVLEPGRDFDELVFGISLGAVAQVCPSLLAIDEGWRRMVDEVETVATQAVQLWMQPNLAELGWRHESPILDAYDDPFNTWADMSFLIERETWAGAQPGSLAYLVGPLHEHAEPPPFGHVCDHQARQVEGVRRRVDRWLDHAGPGLWPASAGPGGGFDRDRLLAGEAGLYARANVAGSERYVQSLAGTTRHRMFTADPGVAHFWPVGDWLNTGINSGDVEAATISGLQAARAILGRSHRIVGEGEGWGRHRVAERVAAPFRP